MSYQTLVYVRLLRPPIQVILMGKITDPIIYKRWLRLVNLGNMPKLMHKESWDFYLGLWHTGS